MFLQQVFSNASFPFPRILVLSVCNGHLCPSTMIPSVSSSEFAHKKGGIVRASIAQISRVIRASCHICHVVRLV